MNFYKYSILFAMSLILPSYSLAGDVYVSKKKNLVNESSITGHYNNSVEYRDDEYGIWSGYYTGFKLASYVGDQQKNEKIRLGVELGYNNQIENFVLGLGISTYIEKKLHDISQGNFGLRELYLDSLLKAGYSIDSFLFYLMGGFDLYLRKKPNVDNLLYVAGIGVDYMLSDSNLSISANYRHNNNNQNIISLGMNMQF
ncbi:outer membrane protein [Candidatus Liberibacter brunswickensis]|uniref:outer membrane protein n=1 Tax=Candidatus Liberibacter brunswickensis TaxID=1968796 RepID=UPI002FE15FBA